MDEYDELKDMLSNDNKAIKEIKKVYIDNLSLLLSKLRSFHIVNSNVIKKYDIENDFESFKNEDINTRFQLSNYDVDCKINLLNQYLKDLLEELEFNKFKKNKEVEMSKNEYLEYINNDMVRNDKIISWYKEFNDK